jgi:hypothetical protein
LEILGVDGKKILKLIFRKCNREASTGLLWLSMGIVDSTGVPRGGVWGVETPRNSEVLKKLGQISRFVEYTFVTN